MVMTTDKKFFLTATNRRLNFRTKPFLPAQTAQASDWQNNLFSSVKESESEQNGVNSWRLIPFFLLLSFSFLLLAARNWKLQITEGEKNRILSEGNRIRINTLTGARGKIFDRNGIILARNGPGLKVVVQPLDMDNREREISLLSVILNENEATIKQKIDVGMTDNAFSDIVIKTNIDHTTQLEILSRKDDLKGVKIEEDIIRDYPDGADFSSIIGYTGEINADELTDTRFSLYTAGDFVGRMGLEQSYENELREKKGKELVEVDAHGSEARVLAKELPQSGNSLVLSISASLQKKSATVLSEALKKYNASGGSVIIQNAKTGEILSMASAPSFDNNLFARGITDAQYAALMNDSAKPMFNRSVSATYPSGSTIKPLMAAAALQERIITSSTTITDTGAINIGSYVFPCWTRAWGYAPHGQINVKEAIAESCDVFFYTIGGGYGSQLGLGIEKMKEYALKFGLSQITGIDLPGEVPGFYPDPQWKKTQTDEPWYLGDTYWVSIGQSYVLVTPLQIANMTTAIANGGTLLKPYLVKEIKAADGTTIFRYQPEVKSEGLISSENLAIVREGMKMGANGGIIFPLTGAKVTVAAKTGTAEYGEKDAHGIYRTHAWVTGFAPYDDPEITFTVFLEDGSKSNNAAEVARSIIDWYYGEGNHGN